MAETLLISSPLPSATELDVMVVLSSDFAPLESIRLGKPGPPLSFPVPIGDHFGWVHEEVALRSSRKGPTSYCPKIVAG